LLDDLEELKADGLTGPSVAISFCRRLIQPLQDRVRVLGAIRPHPGRTSKAEMMARAKNIFGGRIRNRECPKALEVYSPSDPVSHRS
jgi:hypothetical protein